MNKLISIITPSYNSEKFVVQTLQSIIAQTYTHWELLIIDDCSTDSSTEVIQTFADKDCRIKFFKLSENGGAAFARNKGIKEAKGNFIAFLDSDDLWLPEKLEKQLAFMIQNNYNFTYTSYRIYNEVSKESRKTVLCTPRVNYQQLLYSNKIGCLTAMYNQDILGKIFMPTIRKRQDYALWLKILKKEKEAYGLQEILAVYRDRDHSLSNNKIEMLKWNWILYREVEKKSYFETLFYVISNILNKLF
jgi:glycosyltransferase involved in cell wall biosynthesis